VSYNAKVPTGWSRVPIADLCETIVDCVNRTAPIVTEPTPYRMIRTSNVRDGRIDLTDARCVSKDVFDRWTRRQIPLRGDVVLTREAPLGEVGLVRGEEHVFLGQRLVAYRADRQKTSPEFLLYSLMGPDLQAQIAAFGSGSTVEHMRVPDAKKLLVNAPPLPFQERIASILSAYDNLIQVNTRRIAILVEMATHLFDEWFVRYNYPGRSSLGANDSNDQSVPAGWGGYVLGDVLSLSYGKALKADDRIEGPVPVFGSSGVVGWHDAPLVTGPGIIVGRKGNVGAVHWSATAFYPIDTVFYVVTDWPLIFVFHLLRKQTFLNSDSAVPGLNRDQALRKEVAIPPKRACRAIRYAGSPQYGVGNKTPKHQSQSPRRPRLTSPQTDFR